MIKFIKRNATNNILVFLLLLCFWGIIAIGFGFNCLLIDVGNSWSTDTVNSSNDVFKNLSYSYLAGYIVYFLTVVIPYKSKKKQRNKIMCCIINDVYSSFFDYAWIYYNKKNDRIPEIEDYVNSCSESNKSILNECYNRGISDELIQMSTNTILKKYGVFYNESFRYDEFWNTNQLALILKMREIDLFNFISTYSLSQTYVPDFKGTARQKIKEKFIEYFRLVDRLHKTIL